MAGSGITTIKQTSRDRRAKFDQGKPSVAAVEIPAKEDHVEGKAKRVIKAPKSTKK
jgi:hypothetical protein